MKHTSYFRTSSMFLLMVAGLISRGQITLDHTYSGWASVANLSVSGYKYHVLDTQAKTLKLYNTDHSLWKTVNLSVPAGYTLMTNVYNVSENLFSLDNKVGFSYSYYITTPSYTVETMVVNENGTALLTIPGANYAYAYDAGGEAKLLAYIANSANSTYTTKVYNLPGTLISGFSPETADRQFPFPNPAGEFITIPYSAEMVGLQGEVLIYNLSGALVKSYVVDNTFDQLMIPADNLVSGTYLYKIRNSTSETGSGKFVVQ